VHGGQCGGAVHSSCAAGGVLLVVCCWWCAWACGGERRWQEQGAAINRQLKKEAFEKAIRAAMRLLCDEV